MSKYLHNDPLSFIKTTIKGPNNHFKPLNWLLSKVTNVTNALVKTPTKPPVLFSMDVEEAAKHNSVQFDKFIKNNRGTTLNYGSEFRPINQLSKILGQHPNFTAFSEVLTSGMDYQFSWPLPDKTESRKSRRSWKEGTKNQP